MFITDNFRSEVLILSTFEDPNVPLMTNAAGDVDLDFHFSIDDDCEVRQSCSITWGNEIYVFGGTRVRTQISKVTDCHLERVGTLAFEHRYGDCVNVADYLIYLCFDYWTTQKCRVGSSPIGQFNAITSSHYDHQNTRIATNNGTV